MSRLVLQMAVSLDGLVARPGWRWSLRQQQHTQDMHDIEGAGD
jgi:hypothetical protein